MWNEEKRIVALQESPKSSNPGQEGWASNILDWVATGFLASPVWNQSLLDYPDRLCNTITPWLMSKFIVSVVFVYRSQTNTNGNCPVCRLGIRPSATLLEDWMQSRVRREKTVLKFSDYSKELLLIGMNQAIYATVKSSRKHDAN